ncbi:LexA/Signal peptidase [Ramicandelaber brevisporus]|nr:LexA/Signal peptidase [Ramicandelaber brevisporus]
MATAAGSRSPWLRRAASAVLWLPVGIFVKNHVCSFGFIEGRSMQPALNPNENGTKRDIVLYNHWATNVNGSYRRGDVVVFKHPSNPSQQLVKRIIALPGDLVQPLRPYTSEMAHDKMEIMTGAFRKLGLTSSVVGIEAASDAGLVWIPRGHCWVEGDESFHNYDSTQLGPIPMGLISGRVDYVMWPASNMGPVKHEVPKWKAKRTTIGVTPEEPEVRTDVPYVVSTA